MTRQNNHLMHLTGKAKSQICAIVPDKMFQILKVKAKAFKQASTKPAYRHCTSLLKVSLFLIINIHIFFLPLIFQVNSQTFWSLFHKQALI